MADTGSHYSDPLVAKNHVTTSPPVEGDGVEISLKSIFDVLWAYRQALWKGALIAAGAVAVFFIVASFFVPMDRFGTLRFRVLFDGADQGRYPNGTPFSSPEIVATPVLEQVFKSNDLQRYMEFTSLKQSMFALEANPDLELLSFEYQGKLSDAKLTPVDRARIETEFRTKRESLKSAEFSLNLRRSERMERLPTSLVTKVLDDTLAEWARQAREQKGALKYDIPVFSSNILQRDAIRNDDYIIAVDILRTKIGKVLTNIDQISKVPGAALMRTSKTHLSLAEIRSNLDDLLRFDIEPSISLITSAKLSKDPFRAKMYLQDQLRQTALSREQALQRMKAVQDPLRDYVSQTAGRQVGGPSIGRDTSGSQAPLNTPALIPQFGESFLKQLVDMSTQNNDAKYRQELTDRVIAEGLQLASLEKERSYYEALNQSVSGWVKSPNSEASKELVGRLDKSLEAVATSLDDVVAIYDELSSKNLNPGTLLYSVTSPATVHSERAIPLQSLVLFAIVAFLFSVVAITVGCVVHNYYRTEIAPPPPSAPSTRAGQHETV